ncbi:MAG: M24 family metallopeptidase [Gracilibacteraceae bacterium]|nr:M24 family metallopeptidase [Gracilibacteraceae bacterium]
MAKFTKHERVRFPIPQRELERRWDAVRAAMKAQNVDLLIAQNSHQFLGGYVRWFADVPAEHGYSITVLFPKDDEMSLISSGIPGQVGPPVYARRNVKEVIALPYIRTMNHTDSLEPDATAAYIQARKGKKVGLISPANFSAVYYTELLKRLPQVEFVDFTNTIDEIKAVKSEDELAYIRKTVALQDDLVAAMPTIIRPGIFEYEVRQRIVKIAEERGGEEQLIMMSSAPAGTPAGHLNMHYQNRQIQSGDNVMVMIEVNGPGGFYTQVGRVWCFGQPSKELVELWEIAWL